MLRATLLLVQMIGLVLSAYLVFVTFFDQAQIERKVQSYAIVKAEAATTTALDKITGVVKEGGAAAKLGALAQRLRIKASELTANRETIVPSLVRNALSSKCDGECPSPEPNAVSAAP